jgi:hypothetical protein
VNVVVVNVVVVDDDDMNAGAVGHESGGGGRCRRGDHVGQKIHRLGGVCRPGKEIGWDQAAGWKTSRS